MIGIILAALSSFFNEISDSIAKWELIKGKESIYAMEFLRLSFSTLILLVLILMRGKFLFALASLPTFGIRAVLEIAQAQVGASATMKAERGAIAFVMIGTIPLLLMADFLLGYGISTKQIIGIAIILIAIIFLSVGKKFSKRGLGYVFFITVNAVFTISLYKYNITHYNSVEAEQGLMHIILILYFLFMSRAKDGKNPFSFFRKPVFLAQSLAPGVGGVLITFAYAFAPASIILAAKRSTSVFFSTLSGTTIFKERNLGVKLASFVLILVGLMLLV